MRWVGDQGFSISFRFLIFFLFFFFFFGQPNIMIYITRYDLYSVDRKYKNKKYTTGVGRRQPEVFIGCPSTAAESGN
jgi:uncharacterized membrane protein SpoIIM required for sporulation